MLLCTGLRYLVAICRDHERPFQHYQHKLARLDRATPGKGATATVPEVRVGMQREGCAQLVYHTLQITDHTGPQDRSVKAPGEDRKGRESDDLRYFIHLTIDNALLTMEDPRTQGSGGGGG